MQRTLMKTKVTVFMSALLFSHRREAIPTTANSAKQSPAAASITCQRVPPSPLQHSLPDYELFRYCFLCHRG